MFTCKSDLKKVFFCFVGILVFNCAPLIAQERKYTVSNAHAHNDYIHPIPFFTAYNAGFGSIEADIFLKDSDLYVAHTAANITAARTLRSLYLDPLKEMIKKNRGFAYKDSLKNLLLLVDIKTKARPTLDKLIQVLKDYKTLTDCAGLKLVITGNQPGESTFTSYPAYIYFDGSLNKNYTAPELEKIALFSDNLTRYTTWNGEGAPDEDGIKAIDVAVKKAHALKKPIRFWEAPDNPDAWYQLMQLQVDYLNTDKISEIVAFLKEGR